MSKKEIWGDNYIFNISECFYDIIKRELTLVRMTESKSYIKNKKIIFTNIYDFSDETLDIDDDCIDSIIGAHCDEAGTFFIKTDQREISFKTKNEPIIEMIEEG